MYCRPSMVFVMKVLRHHRWSTIHHLQQTQSYTRKTVNTHIIDGRQYIIYNRHNHIHVKPSTQYCRPSMMFVLTVLRVYDCVCCKWCIVDHRWCLCWRFYVYMILSRWSTIHHLQQTKSYTRKTVNTNIIDGRQYIIYYRHNHIHVKPSTQTPSMVDNTFYVYMIVSVVNDVLSTIDGVCVDGFTCIWFCLL
jgi:gamma-glutamylcyclotransferase (GGCT)/AIG2-like uncharacterized protein YtfP